jgi:chromosome segregation ATPase
MSLDLPDFVVGFGWVEHADETEQIVVVLETRVDALEQEGAQRRNECKEFHQAQIRVLNSLRETQIEHGETLKEHSTAIGGVQATLKEHSTAIGGVQATLKEHSTAIANLGTEVRGLRETQLEHGRLLHEVGIGMAGIARSLDHLINEQGQSRS